MNRNAPIAMFEGWNLLGMMMMLVTGISGVLLVSLTNPVIGVHAVIRVTAWTSFALFILAFTAAAMADMKPGSFTFWQRRNRRFLGLSFAVSHLVHAIAILAYIRLAPELFWQDRTPAANIPGLIGYAFIIVMAATSFAAPARLVGVRLWKLLHGIGVWVIWFDFVAASAKRIPQSLGYIVPVAIALAALVLRLAAAQNRRHSSGQSAVAAIDP